MENKKYYTPTIEEFYVGFEFCSSYKEHWSNHTVLVTTDLNNINRILKREDADFDVRVKYLDKNDIEDCGRGFKKDSAYSFVNKDNIFIEFSNLDDFDKQEIQIFNNCDPLFKGKIKNKSELAKILEQLKV